MGEDRGTAIGREGALRGGLLTRGALLGELGRGIDELLMTGRAATGA